MEAQHHYGGASLIAHCDLGMAYITPAKSSDPVSVHQEVLSAIRGRLDEQEIHDALVDLIRQSPNNAQASALLAVFKYNLGHGADVALRQALRAATSDLRSHNIRYTLGMMYYANKQIVDAREEWRTVDILYRMSDELVRLKKMLQERHAGDELAGKADYDRLEEIYSSDSNVRNAKIMLKLTSRNVQHSDEVDYGTVNLISPRLIKDILEVSSSPLPDLAKPGMVNQQVLDYLYQRAHLDRSTLSDKFNLTAALVGLDRSEEAAEQLYLTRELAHNIGNSHVEQLLLALQAITINDN